MVNNTCNMYPYPSDKVIKEIPTGVNPAGMDITPDGKYLYVANSNNYGLINQDTVSVIDLEKNIVIKTITDMNDYENILNTRSTVLIFTTGRNNNILF